MNTMEKRELFKPIQPSYTDEVEIFVLFTKKKIYRGKNPVGYLKYETVFLIMSLCR